MKNTDINGGNLKAMQGNSEII